jgi:hypothetical protein
MTTPKEYRGVNKKAIPPSDTPLAAYLRRNPHLTYYQISKQAGIHFSRTSRIARGVSFPTTIEVLKLEHYWSIPASSWARTELGQRLWNRFDEDLAHEREMARARWRRWAKKHPEKLRQLKRKQAERRRQRRGQSQEG